jgi:hypothetical protein
VAGETAVASGRRARLFHTSSDTDSNSRFDEEKRRVTTLSQVAPAVLAGHLSTQMAPMQAHAPQLAQQLQANAQKATQFLASKLPPAPLPAGLQPQLADPQYSAHQKAQFLRYVDAVNGGPPAIMQRLASNKITAEDIETMKAVYPAQYAAIAVKLQHKALAQSRPIHLQKSLQISRFIGQPLVPQAQPDFLRVAAASYAAHGHRAQQPSTPRNSSGKLNYSKNLMGPFERAQSGN